MADAAAAVGSESRRTAATMSCEVFPAGLSMSRTPSDTRPRLRKPGQRPPRAVYSAFSGGALRRSATSSVIPSGMIVTVLYSTSVGSSQWTSRPRVTGGW